jgi:undecaprenyl-diphosphatase
MPTPAALVPSVYAHDPMLVVQHALATPALDPVMAGLSRAAEEWVLALAAVAVALLVSRRDPRRWALAAGLAAAFVVDGAAVWALKHALDLPRPLAVLGPDQVRVLLQPLRVDSMPSGHASAAATLASWATWRSRRTGVALWAVALLVGVSRVYVGAHWVEDVVAGWAVGAVAGAAAAWATAALLARAAARQGAGEATAAASA